MTDNALVNMLPGFVNPPAGMRKFKIAHPLAGTGRLLIIEPGYPGAAMAAIPAAGGATRNLAAQSLIALTGTTPALAEGNFLGTSAGNVRVELSGKGGMHGFTRQGVATSSKTTGLQNTPASDYVRANAGTRTIYQALAGVLTQDAASGTTPETIMAGYRVDGSADQGGFRPVTAGTISPVPSAKATPNLTTAPRTVGAPFLVDAAFTGLAGIGTTNTVVRWSDVFTASALTANSSWILYFYVLIDLTAAGLTYAQAHTLVQNYYTAQVATPGARYYGDTYTNPATFAWS